MATFQQNQEENLIISAILNNITRPIELSLVPREAISKIDSLRSEYEQVIRPNTLDNCKAH